MWVCEEEEAVARRPTAAVVDDGDLAHEAGLGGQGEADGRKSPPRASQQQAERRRTSSRRRAGDGSNARSARREEDKEILIWTNL